MQRHDFGAGAGDVAGGPDGGAAHLQRGAIGTGAPAGAVAGEGGGGGLGLLERGGDEADALAFHLGAFADGL